MTVARATLTVGVTGHRPNRLALSPPVLQRRCLDALSALVRGSRRCRHVAVSALAEGADRAFAEAALMARYELHVVLPFSDTDYETTFGDALDLHRYRSLLGDAARLDALPGSLAAAEDGYLSLGARLVARSDVLVAVWDGAPGQGRGGTPDIIQMALRACKPVIWIDATGQNRRRLITAPLPDWQVPLSSIKARARPLGRNRCAALARWIVSRQLASACAQARALQV